MEKAGNITSLRNMAPHWSLAGDKQLLNTLQDIHQKIMNHCYETNTKLEEMATALDGANIDLQNVNNKFMALSNTQFIESRVYEDDVDSILGETPVKVNSTQDVQQVDKDSELGKIKESLKILESMHECVTILNSDSDSDSDDDGGRIVYKPKNLYSDRPLPHIIGSQAWKNKWHAGIIAEDSDSDSSITKPEDAVMDQYSESDSELTDMQTDRLHPPHRTVSSSSSMADSEPSVPPAPVSQAHIAAELARKLGGNILEVPIRTPEREVPTPQAVPPKIYKPQNPTTSTIFFDEPPPPDQTYQSDNDDYNVDDDDDIFADLHKRKPSFSKNKDQGRLNEELFGGLKSSHNVADDLFGVEQSDPNETVNKEVTFAASRESDKKPIGGIALFGSSQGAESIGAAILKRNRSKTYSSDEESEKEVFKNKPVKEMPKESVKKIKNIDASKLATSKISEKEENRTRKLSEKPEKDILQDIFSKNTRVKSKAENYQNTKKESNSKENVIDLFGDNLFDDIDDIFTDDIKKVPLKEPNKNAKSIFDDDDDDDDLFADITVTNKNDVSTKKTEALSLFGSDKDDDLFTDKPKQSSSDHPKVNNTNDIKTSYIKETKSIFGEESDDDIFCEPDTNVDKNNKTINFNVNKTVEDNDNANINKIKVDKVDDDNNNQFSEIYSLKKNVDGTFNNELENIVSVDTGNKQIIEKVSDIFLKSSDSKNVSITSPLQSTNVTNEVSPALFDDEEINDMFQNVPKISNKIEDNARIREDIKYEEPPTENQEILNNVIIPPTGKNRDGNELTDKSLNKLDVNLKLFDDDIPSSNECNYIEETSESALRPIDSDKTKHNTFDQLENFLPQVPNEHFSHEADTFDDIFIEGPPAFEKPKEPKKSRNINALFDDDSDDEALFFKKVDVVSDEKPNLGPATKEDNLFSIFSDEPPAIDVDFPQSSLNNQIEESVQHKEFDSKNQSFLIQSIHPYTEINANFDKQAKTNITQEDLQYNIEVGNNFDNIDHTKTIGKLKPMNFNINVNTLLPGASPKKLKVTEEIDGHVVSLANSNTKLDINESLLVKLVSFEGEADSELLNNKLSKERAKIQVKRRPSTRKARREAVKKSGIDFGSNDSTDNSSSIDDPKVTPVVTEQEKSNNVLDEISKVKDIKSKVVYILNDEDIFNDVNTDKTLETISKVQSLKEGMNTHNTKKIATPEFDNEDISKTIKIDGGKEKVDSTSRQPTIDKVDGNSSIKPETIYKEPHKNKASIFDDMSDEEAELFHNKKTIVANKKSIFGSDSEEDLFANSGKRISKTINTVPKTTNLKVESKKPLFDDDSDSDLFGSSIKSSGNKPFTLPQKQVKNVQTKVVNEDPLSLLSDGD